MNPIIFTEPTISGIGYLVKVIIELCSSIAVGIVLFTVILKLITLPFDFMSKRSMRKNSVLMEKMRPELEKLQKQYANDKALYNQKMQALYKKNGYSMFGACLPTIITLVVFIVAINGFTTFANYQNQKYFYQMSVAYNQAIYDGFDTDGEKNYGEYVITTENDKGQTVLFDVDYQSLFDLAKNSNVGDEISVTGTELLVKKINRGSSQYLTVYTNSGYVYVSQLINEDLSLGGEFYFVDSAKLNGKTVNGLTYTESAESENKEVDAENFIKDIAATYSKEEYMGLNNSFFWVKNIWVTDSPLSHPIISDYATFKSTYGYNDQGTNTLDDTSYKLLISKLGDEAGAPNGYFVLAILTALTSLALQLITSKSQKAQMELQTVDGQGAQTNKMMTWMMPIMMAVFAFMMTAAFSIYMIVSSVISIITTFVINKLVDFGIKKEEQKNATDVVRGRIHTKEEPKAKEKKKKPEKEATQVDFMNTTEQNKRIRGRIKKD